MKFDAQYGIQFNFGRQSKIVLLPSNVKPVENAPTTLEQIVKAGLSGRNDCKKNDN